jgi:hypothetical protein
MLQHLSARFRQNAAEQGPEPRAALFLNRFTRTLTIMYATSGIEKIVGISSEDMKGRSFYYCIAEASLQEAVRVLESAKGNDSIAYVRFNFRDPRQDDPTEETTDESDVTDTEMTDAGATDTDEATPNVGQSPSNAASGAQATSGSASMSISSPSGASGATSGSEGPIELEAVVSCTSDGLVVVLRRARPQVPPQMHDSKPVLPVHQQQQPYTGYFAAPWGVQPIYYPAPPTGFAGTSMYPGMPAAFGGPPIAGTPSASTPYEMDFLSAIKECGVFAWDLVGINGELSEYARGDPTGRAAPADGPAVWDPNYKEGDASSSGRGTTS